MCSAALSTTLNVSNAAVREVHAVLQLALSCVEKRQQCRKVGDSFA